VIDNGLADVNSVLSSNKGRMLENAVFLGLRRSGKDIFTLKMKENVTF
jgi:predicted AAA+ superfamily ATPase